MFSQIVLQIQDSIHYTILSLGRDVNVYILYLLIYKMYTRSILNIATWTVDAILFSNYNIQLREVAPF